MKKTISMIASVGIASAALLSVACGGTDEPTPIPSGTGGSTPAGTGGGTPAGTGGDTPAGTGGDTGGGTVSNFVVGGLGTAGDWSGYLFTVANEAGTGEDGAYDASTIMPAEFTGAQICASGTLVASWEAFGLVGWNIAQEIDPETMMGGAEMEILPGGTGIKYNIVNNEGGDLRIQIQDNSDTSAGRWCAAVPGGTGSGTIAWGDFATECWGIDWYRLRSDGQPHLADWCPGICGKQHEPDLVRLLCRRPRPCRISERKSLQRGEPSGSPLSFVRNNLQIAFSFHQQVRHSIFSFHQQVRHSIAAGT